MKAIVINQFGAPSVFQEVQVDKPHVIPGHVLIKVMATSVNPVDTKIRSGAYAVMVPSFPAVLHSDVAGVIEEVGEGVSDFKVGDDVFGCAGGMVGISGALGEYMLADAHLIAKKPSSLSMAQAAALPLVSITAWEGLFEKLKIQPNQTILIHAGLGGVGHIAVQLAAWAGAHVTATVSTDEKAKLVKSLGANETVNYKEEPVQEYVARLTNSNGFDCVFDTVGGDNIARSMEALALYGQVATIQANSTQALNQLHAKSASLHVVFMLIPLIHHIQRERHGKILRKIAELVDAGHVAPLIDGTVFSFDEVEKAHARLESGRAIGKVVISRETTF